MKQYLTATMQAASQSEIEGIVDPMRLKDLKLTDPDPTIRVYSLGHEGAADLGLPGIGRKTFTWIQAAVQWVSDKLMPGTPVFEAHDANTNSHEGRTSIGEVVGRTVRRIGDHVNALAAIYIKPEFKSRPLDFASIEAEIEFADDGHQAWPTAINAVTGIALGNSAIASPGIPGATLLGAVQAYAVQAFADEGVTKMNKSEVQEAVKSLGLSPSDLFSVEDVTGDKKVRTNLQEAATRVGRERDTARERVAELENKQAETEQNLKRLTVQSKSASIFDTVITDRKLDDKAKAFVARNMKRFESAAADEDALKVDVGKFVDSQVEEFKEVAGILGVKTETPVADPNEFKLPADLLMSNQPAPTPGPNMPAPPTTMDDEIRAEMDPATNFLIPGGKAAEAQ